MELYALDDDVCSFICSRLDIRSLAALAQTSMSLPFMSSFLDPTVCPLLTLDHAAAVCNRHGWPLPSEDAACREDVQQQWGLMAQIISGYDFTPTGLIPLALT